MAGETVEMEKMTLMKDGVKIADLTRIFQLDTNEHKTRVDFSSESTAQDKGVVKDILSKNISMFGRGENGSIKWIHLKKGTVQHWVFAGFELEKRGFQVQRDEKTAKYLKKFISIYFPQGDVKNTAKSS